MGTITRARVRNLNTDTQSSSIMNNAAVLAAAIADFEVKIYGGDGKPLYEMVSEYGVINVSNTIDTAFNSFAEMTVTLKDGEAGYLYSEEYDRFTLAIKLPNSGIVFAALLHDGNGQPRVADQLTLARVMAVRDLEKDGEVIITKGQEFLKALPQEYAMRLDKAA